jgi:hypothetical protein
MLSFKILSNLLFTRNYRVSGPRPSYGVLKNHREYNVSETKSISFFRLGLEALSLFGSLERAVIEVNCFIVPLDY